ncbi:MAG: type III-A CRISPR-associated RAMP protein Csm5 [Saprospiraceae bacterium]
MELYLRTLTPLHVGDGSQLHSFDYVLHGGRFYRVSQQKFEQFLKQVDAGDPELKNAIAFTNWANEMASQIESVETDRRNAGREGGRDYNQQLSRLRSEYNLLAFAKTIGKERPFLDFLKKLENKVRSLPLLMEGGRPKQEIRGFQRDADGRAYLPGSSVKGCIRTALLYHYLTEYADYQSIHERLSKEVEKIKADREEAEKRRIRFSVEKYRKSFGEAIEYEAFFAGMITERGQVRPGEAQDDLLRCLLIADTALPEDGLGVENIDLYLVKKLPKGQGNQAQRQPQSPAVEAVVPGQVFPVKLDFNLELLLQLHHVETTSQPHRAVPGDDGFMVKNERHFIGWRKRAKWLFDLDAADFESIPRGTRPDDPRCQTLRDKALAHIFGCVQRFSDAQASAYDHWQKNYVKPEHDGRNDARNVGAGAKSIAAAGLRLHLGFATGFEGMTEVLYLLVEHKPLFADIMELFAIGDSPSAWKNRRPGDTYRANPDQFPKSRRLVSRSGVALPLGWLVQVEAGAKSQSGGDPAVAVAVPTPPSAPTAPTYLRGTLKIGAELSAELISGGNPGRFKLFIRTDYEPIVDVKYPAGFKAEDVGRIALVRVKNLKGKEEVTVVEFVRFK